MSFDSKNDDEQYFNYMQAQTNFILRLLVAAEKQSKIFPYRKRLTLCATVSDEEIKLT